MNASDTPAVPRHAEPSFYRAPDANVSAGSPTRRSSLGIASTLLAVLGWAAFAGLFAIILDPVRSQRVYIDPQLRIWIPILMLSGCAAFLGGVVTGFIALLQPDRRRGFAWSGLALSGLAILAIVGLLAIGALLKH